MKIYPQNPIDMQNQQPMHIQNPINAQSFQPIQPQNPMTMHSYQPTQMQNSVMKPDKNDEVQCSNTKNIYQNIQKEQPREKIWTIPFLLESPRSKENNHQILKLIF